MAGNHRQCDELRVGQYQGWHGVAGGIYQQQDAQYAPGIHAQVDDAAAYQAKAQEFGGTLVQPAMETPGMGIMVGMFQDPEGNRFGVVQPLHDHG